MSFPTRGLPVLLLLQIKRWMRVGVDLIKDDTPVSVPRELSVPSDGQDVLYDLVGVVLHHAAAVHYTSFALVDGEWWHFDDYCGTVAPPITTGSEPYLALYTKRAAN